MSLKRNCPTTNVETLPGSDGANPSNQEEHAVVHSRYRSDRVQIKHVTLF